MQEEEENQANSRVPFMKQKNLQDTFKKQQR